MFLNQCPILIVFRSPEMSTGHSYTTMTAHLIRIIKEQLILFILCSEHNCDCLYLLMDI